MKLPKESTLWRWSVIGLGLIIGVAVIAIMNTLNDFLNSVYGDPASAFADDLIDTTNITVYLIGKVISILSGCFTAGAIIKFLRPDIEMKSLIGAGFIFASLSLFDVLLSSLPWWYQIISLIVPIPAVLLGNYLIKQH